MDKIEYTKDKRGKWRWARVAPNGRIVGASSQGFSRLRACERNFLRGLNRSFRVLTPGGRGDIVCSQ
jgi:uncharacterized protein YegP (UPF0339 family)